MTLEEINTKINQLEFMVRNSSTSPTAQVEGAKALGLWEIARQLAKANELKEKVDWGAVHQ